MKLANRVVAAGAILLGCIGIAGQADAQQSKPITSAEDGQQLTVDGHPMPSAEAPRSATCEALTRDPTFVAWMDFGRGEPLMGPRVYLPTRMPRNPDYSAPPSVAPGSALPTLPKRRFGQRYGDAGRGFDDGLALVTGADPLTGEASGVVTDTSRDAAIAQCRAGYTRGGGERASAGSLTANSSVSELGTLVFDPSYRMGQTNARFAQGRSFMVSRDRTLPMALALFDQGRYAESLGWFRTASNKLGLSNGGDEAALFVGKLYLQGLGDKSDPAEGVKWLKKAATAPFNPTNELPIFDPRQPERNTALGEASVILANVYRRGFGPIAKDPEAARKWLERAFDVGHVPAAKALGDIYYRGIDTPRDVAKAVQYYRKAATLNHPAAQVALANILYAGEEGIAQDRHEALGWYSAAARNFDAGALYALGRAYDLGEGAKADPERAIAYYKAAALSGNAPAQVAMGTYFYEGGQVPKDPAMARRWFEVAVAGGDADGMTNLAAMLARGEGGDKDMARAAELLKRAVALGHPAAPRALAVIEQRMASATVPAVGKAVR